MTITEFLLARLDEDEAVARAVADLAYAVDMGGNRLDERWYVSRLKFSSLDGMARSAQDEEATALFARHDPARILAEVAAKRAIVEEAGQFGLWEGGMGFIALCHLASVYADHLDYRNEWKP